MRIAILNSYYSPDEVGGAEKSVRFIAEGLVQSGHEVKVLCTGRSHSKEEIHGVNVERLPVKNVYHPLDAKSHGRLEKMVWHSWDSYNLASESMVLRALREFSPQVVHTNTLAGISTSAWSAAHKLGVPIVHTLRDYYLLCPNSAMFSKGQQCQNRCAACRVLSVPKRAASSAVSTVVGNSQFILDKHLQYGYFRNAKKLVIYNAYQPQSELSFQDDRSTIVFGFIGRIAPTKGVDVLLDAFRKVYQSHKHIRLLIAGEAESQAYSDQLKPKCEGLPVEFLGRVLPHEFYSQVHWSVIPSLWHEPLARVTFESFAHGVPLIVSRTGGSSELIRVGENGFTYDATEVTQLSDLISRAVRQSAEDYQMMRGHCLSDAKNFLPDRVIRNYIAAYQATIEASPLSIEIQSEAASSSLT